MLRMRIEARHGLRWGLLSLATAIALTAVSSDPADARSKRAKRANTSGSTSSYSPAYAAIVVDANSGAVMHSANADAIRHPASLTKIMTLYMLFERLDSGKLSLESPLRVSEHAANQAPTKLGVREGSTISVEDAIKGLITRSANDAAVVVAENLAGSEEEFARQMTRKARALGMANTTYRNASGLPDSAQVSTARDQATLGRAIQERFPRYYKYFSTRTFTFRGQRIGNHNRLLGQVEGVDGIKTGYIRASGFNLVTSVKRNGRHVVAVVLGGTSAGARDARMRQLLAQHVDRASTRKTAPMIAEAPVRDTPAPQARTAAARTESATPSRFEMASAVSMPLREAPRGFAPAAGSDEPIRPVAVRTVSVKPAPIKSAKNGTANLAAPAPTPAPAVAAVPAAPQADAPATVRAEAPLPAPARAGTLGFLPAPTRTASVSDAVHVPAPTPVRETPQREAAVQPAPPPAPAAPAARPPQTRSGWVIQVGAYPAESEAKERLAMVKSKASRLLASASPFTETVQRGETTLYRARFAGLEREQAEAACKFLKRNDVDCLAMKN
ncbi:MAG: D-alanyl-D-alanine carboxypeptidase [Xanthobacteraceae bacterium]|nr:D-alanyl-D-alanine carboxypeptidase [Xanthobacteraceae bacterium]